MDRPLNPSEDLPSSPAPEKGSLTASFLKSFVAVIFGIGLGALVLKWTGVTWDGLKSTVATADKTKLVLALIGTYVLSAAQAVRWQAVLKGIAPVRFFTVFQSKLVGYAANCVLPARLGDLVRMEFVSALIRVPRTKIIATGVVDLWFDKIGWVIVFFGALLTGEPMPGWVLNAMFVMMGIVVVMGFVLAMLARKSVDLKPETFLYRFREGLNQPHLAKLLIKQVWLSPLSWIWEVLLIQYVMSAFGVEINFAQAFAVVTSFNVAMVVPIPGSAGAFEAASIFVLKAFGVDPDKAAAFSVIYHLIFLVPGVITGAAIFGVYSSEFQLFKILKKKVAA